MTTITIAKNNNQVRWRIADYIKITSPVCYFYYKSNFIYSIYFIEQLIEKLNFYVFMLFLRFSYFMCLVVYYVHIHIIDHIKARIMYLFTHFMDLKSKQYYNI